MEIESKNSTDSVKQTVWQYLFNFKVAVSASIVWIGLICQDFYVYVLNFTWISDWKLGESTPYKIEWILTLLFLYCLFCLINYLVKLPALQMLYHKKIANITLIVWFIMNISCYHLLYFDYVIDIVNNTIYTLKVVHLISLYALILVITSLFQRRKENNVKHQLILTGIFCTFGWIFLLLTYPGTWGNDDILIINVAGNYMLSPWHHFFSGTFHILCLQTLPFVFSVPFFQVLLNALMFSYCVITLANVFTKTKKQRLVLEVLLSLVFFFPPVLFHMLGGFRMAIYQFLVLYLLTKMVHLYYNKEQRITVLTLIEICFLTIIVGTWRTECFFFPFIILIMLLLFNKKRIKKIVAVLIASITLTGVIYVGIINDKLIGNDNYKITATLQIVIPIINHVDNLDEDTLNILDNILDLNKIKEVNSDEIWKHVAAKVSTFHFTNVDCQNYYKKTVELIFKYPDIVFQKMVKTFHDTALNITNFPISQSIYNFKNIGETYSYFSQDKINSSFFHKPINLNLRNNVIELMNGFSVGTMNVTILHKLFYNLYIPIILGFISFLLSFFIRKKFLILIFITLLINFVVIFITAPAVHFYYYLPIYLCLYVFSIPIIWNATAKLIEKIKNFRKK